MPSPAPSMLAMGAIAFRDRPFADIIASASASGFDGIGITVGQCVSALERGVSIPEIATRVEDAGLRVAELELWRLADHGPTRFANTMVEDLVGVLHPDRLHTAAFTGEAAEIADEFAALCSRLDPLPVAIEFMPYSRIPSPAATMEIIAGSGQPNARICFDVLHFFRSGGVFADLTAEVLAKVSVVQLSDVVERPGVSLVEESRHLRSYPGRGNLDIVGFLRAIGEVLGTLPPLTIEPVSDAIELLPLPLVAEEIMFTTLQVVERAGFALRDGRFVAGAAGR